MFVLSLDDQEISEKFSFTEFTSRYLDDLLLLNDKDEFAKIFKDIYPHELELLATIV